MKNRKVFLLILFSIFIFFSCKNLVDSDRIYLDISIGKIISRTIIPEYNLETSTDYVLELKGSLNGASESVLATWESDAVTSAYSKMTADNSVFVYEGSWSFTFNVKTTEGIVILTSSLSKTISSADNTLEFSTLMPPINAEDTSGFTITLYYPLYGASYVKAGLYNVTTGDVITGYEDLELTQESGELNSVTMNYVTYSKTEVLVGSYMVKFSFYDNSDNLIHTYYDTIWICPEIEINFTDTIRELSTPYTINYTTAGGTINGPYVTSFNQFMTVTLPTDVTQEENVFDGWYDNKSYTGTPVTTIPQGTTGAKYFYAKWINGTAVDIGDLATTITSAAKSKTLVVTGTLTQELLTSTATALKAAYTANSTYTFSLNFIKATGDFTTIANETFKDCTNLIGIVVPEFITSIGSNVFTGCTNLQGITLPDSLSTIGTNAFTNCTSLSSITIPKSVTNFGSSVFQDCTSLTDLQVDLNNANYNAIDSVMFSEDGESLICYPCGLSASTYEIPNTVKNITSTAFLGCKNLTSITLTSIETIGVSAFSGCTRLTSIIIPNTVISIGNYGFYGCSELTSITISSSVTEIGIYSFSSCNNLSSITFDDTFTWFSVTDESDYQAKTNGTLMNVSDPTTNATNFKTENYFFKLEAVAYDGNGNTGGTVPSYEVKTTDVDYTVSDNTGTLVKTDYAFKRWNTEADGSGTSYSVGDLYTDNSGIILYAQWIPSYTAENVVSVINTYTSGDYEIYVTGAAPTDFLSNLKTSLLYDDQPVDFTVSLDLSSVTGLTEIGASALSSTNRLVGLVLPDIITSIGNYAFNTSSIESLVIPANVGSLGEYAFELSSIKSISFLGNEITTLSTYLFSECSQLEEINIPSSVTEIGEYTFNYCIKIKELIIPDSVTTIGKNAFNECTSLTSIEFSDSTSTWKITDSSANVIATGVTVSDSGTNATNLITTYVDYTWTKE